MHEQSLVVIGAGALPELSMREGVQSLAAALGLPLQTVAAGACADSVLDALEGAPPALIRLAGDAGCLLPHRRSWLEALGAWRSPTLILGMPGADGLIPGVVPAFLALCKVHKVSLLGLAQLGGPWTPADRRRDGLPWLGCLAPHAGQNADVALDELSTLIRLRLAQLMVSGAREAS